MFSIEDRGGSSDFNQTNRMDLFVARKEGESDSDWEKRTNSYGRVKVKAKILKSGTERIWEWPSGNSTASSVSNSNVVSGKNTGINTKVIYNNLRVVTKTGEKPAPLTSNCKDAVELYWNKTTTLSGEGSTEAGFSGSIVGSTFMQGEENTVTTFAGTFPKYRQTSQYEWSKWPYADETIADEGCGPTSLAIILSGLGLGSYFQLAGGILAIDPILDMGRTMLNVNGTMTSAITVANSLNKVDKNIFVEDLVEKQVS